MSVTSMNITMSPRTFNFLSDHNCNLNIGSASQICRRIRLTQNTPEMTSPVPLGLLCRVDTSEIYVELLGCEINNTHAENEVLELCAIHVIGSPTHDIDCDRCLQTAVQTDGPRGPDTCGNGLLCEVCAFIVDNVDKVLK